MRFFHESHEPQTTPQYVSDLTRRLQRSLPHDKAEQIAQETQFHLEDRVDDLMQAGLDRTQAEATALAGFGSVRSYARAATINAYSDRTSVFWHIVGRLGMANFLAFNALHVMYPTNEMASFTVAPALGCVALCFVSALASRRPQTRQLAALSVIGLLAVGAIAGVRYVPNADTPALGLASLASPRSTRHGGPGLPRGDYSREIAHEKYRQRLLYRETDLLQRGTELYAQGKPIPASLRSGERYIVPLPYRAEWNTMSDGLDMSAFKEYYWPNNTLSEWETMLNSLPYWTVATPEEARQCWAERGPLWLNGKLRRVAYNDAEFATMKRAETAPLGFNSTAAVYHMYRSAPLCLTLLVLDFVLAYLGRMVWIQSRNSRRRHVA